MIIKMAWEWGQWEEHAPNWLRLLLEVFVGVHTLFHCWKLVTPAGVLPCLLVLRHQGSARTCKYGQPLANEIVPAEAPIYWYVLLWSLLVLLLHVKSSSITPKSSSITLEVTTTVHDWLVRSCDFQMLGMGWVIILHMYNCQLNWPTRWHKIQIMLPDWSDQLMVNNVLCVAELGHVRVIWQLRIQLNSAEHFLFLEQMWGIFG